MYSPIALPGFFISTDELSVAGFAGKILCCDFNKEKFQSSFFTLYGIDFPETLQRSVPKRQAEFFAGRYLAANVMQQMGVSPVTIAIGEHRAPVWPSGFVGSITHHAHSACCALAMAKDYRGLGIDLELWMNESLARDTSTLILNEAERQLLNKFDLPFEQKMTLVFSAKESLFKTLYPAVKRYFDFLDAQIIALDVEAGTFTLALTAHLTDEFVVGSRFSGHFRIANNQVLTMLWY